MNLYTKQTDHRISDPATIDKIASKQKAAIFLFEGVNRAKTIYVFGKRRLTIKSKNNA